MTVTADLGATALGEPEYDVLQAASHDGFSLVQYETPTGQLVWEWRRGNEPRPQFVTRRVAVQWMRDLLGRAG
jgi:hypothetical protein